LPVEVGLHFPESPEAEDRASDIQASEGNNGGCDYAPNPHRDIHVKIPFTIESEHKVTIRYVEVWNFLNV
jgi:hypothetical protein